ncbi:hypothetical protein [Ligilactobacillus saerimneri]|uniref:Uncharacterized protein n=1 Tax=Ligilactobacillus saerimneri 30a TaxID=1227363 RepID=M5J4H9_9LACO|nr:hypothetical protein [Ligilactobacillus saerimneri]EKW99233.1 hypothetical protein D271_03720 [Ligilactobacillus saerimneri 30a]
MRPKKIADTIRKIVPYFVLLVLHEIFISFVSYHHVWILSTLQFYIHSIINSLPFTADAWIELFSRLVFPFVFVAILSSKLAVPLQVIDTLASENEAANPRVKIYFGLVTATARKAWSKW